MTEPNLRECWGRLHRGTQIDVGLFDGPSICKDCEIENTRIQEYNVANYDQVCDQANAERRREIPVDPGPPIVHALPRTKPETEPKEPTMKTRICNTCQEDLDQDEFRDNGKEGPGRRLSKVCLSCEGKANGGVIPDAGQEFPIGGPSRSPDLIPDDEELPEPDTLEVGGGYLVECDLDPQDVQEIAMGDVENWNRAAIRRVFAAICAAQLAEAVEILIEKEGEE